jgi:hypothetical protein
MRNRSQKVLDVMKQGADISMKTTRRRDLFCAERQRSQEGSRRDCYPMWKELFLEALFLGTLLESDNEKLTELLQATEQAMVLRAQELLNSSDHHEEHGEMNTALASVLSIKTDKLGWPAVSARDGLS